MAATFLPLNITKAINKYRALFLNRGWLNQTTLAIKGHKKPRVTLRVARTVRTITATGHSNNDFRLTGLLKIVKLVETGVLQ